MPDSQWVEAPQVPACPGLALPTPPLPSLMGPRQELWAGMLLCSSRLWRVARSPVLSWESGDDGGAGARQRGTEEVPATQKAVSVRIQEAIQAECPQATDREVIIREQRG